MKTSELYDLQADELYRQDVWKDPVRKHEFYRIASDRPYHYLGSGKVYWRMGKAFGDAMFEILDQQPQ